jgi:pyruvate ferredoxin oxidoreductase beta subunit
VATVSPAYPNDLRQKVKKALDMTGYRYIHVLAPCPTGWGYDPAKTVKIARDAVKSGIFPLYEIEGGKLSFTIKLKERIPVKEYLAGQRRFRHLDDDEVDKIQMHVEDRIKNLVDLTDVRI